MCFMRASSRATGHQDLPGHHASPLRGRGLGAPITSFGKPDSVNEHTSVYAPDHGLWTEPDLGLHTADPGG